MPETELFLDFEPEALLFTVPTAHKNRSMPYKERLPGGFHNWNLSSW